QRRRREVGRDVESPGLNAGCEHVEGGIDERFEIRIPRICGDDHTARAVERSELGGAERDVVSGYDGGGAVVAARQRAGGDESQTESEPNANVQWHEGLGRW